MARYGTGEALLDTHLEQAVTLLEDALRRARALGERYLTGCRPGVGRLRP